MQLIIVKISLHLVTYTSCVAVLSVCVKCRNMSLIGVFVSMRSFDVSRSRIILVTIELSDFVDFKFGQSNTRLMNIDSICLSCVSSKREMFACNEFLMYIAALCLISFEHCCGGNEMI